MPDNKDTETTADGRYLIINGRKWRASDPGIPPKLRQELVDELMSARRAVRGKEADARARVNDAKIALGERGQPWWEEADAASFEQRIAATIRVLLRKRVDKSICPSDVARVVGGEGETWRQHMDQVRAVAAHMVSHGEIIATQKGVPVQADKAHGPLRLIRATPGQVLPGNT